MKRSTFVKISVLGIIVALLAAYVLRFKRTVRSMIERDSAELTFKEENVIDRFMTDADQEDYWRQFSTSKKMFICVQHFFYSFGIHLPYYAKYLQYRSQITGQFLLSTNLFNDMSNRNLIYTGFFNQYRRPCSNPFSANVYPGTV